MIAVHVRIASVAVLLTMIQAGGQSQAQRTPPSRIDANGNVLDSAYLRMPLSGNDRKYVALDGDAIKRLLVEVVELTRKMRPEVEINGNRYWGRIPGTKGEAAAADWVESKFRQSGLTAIRRREFALTKRDQWYPASYDVTIEAGGKLHRFSSLVPGLRADPKNGTLDFESVWVGLGSEADFIGRDVRGKAVFIHSIPAPGSMFHSAQSQWEDFGGIRRAVAKGASAVFVIYGISDNWTIWQGAGRNPGGAADGPHTTNELEIPNFFMGYQDGMAVRKLIEQGQPVRVKGHFKAGYREGGKTVSVSARLPGATDEEIYVLAHMDGYFEAALDNAGGMAVMVSLAQYFSRIPQAQRRRSMVFIGTAGHHVGSPEAQSMRANFDKELAKAVLMINAEHIIPKLTTQWGPRLRKADIVSPSRWWVSGNPRLVEMVLNVYRTFGVPVYDTMEASASGEMLSVAPFLPSVQIIESPEIKHTDDDLPEWVPASGLEAIARSYAKIIDEANRMSRRDLGPPVDDQFWRTAEGASSARR